MSDPPARRVLHLVNMDMSRGAQAYARAIGRALSSEGEVHRTMTIFDAPPAALRPDASLAVPRGRWRRVGLDPRAVIRLWRHLRSEPAAVIIAHGGEAFRYAALTRPRGVPLVYYRVGTTAPAIRFRAQRWLHRSLARRATAVVCVSEDVARETAELLVVPASRISVIVNGRDPAAFPITSDRRAKRGVTLGLVGRLVPDKRPEWLLEITAALRSEGLDVEGLCVGDGPLADRLSDAAAAAGVSLLGRRDDIAGLLARIDVLLLSSRPPEGMPGVLIEAGLAGVAVVATDTPGVRDVVVPEVTGLVVAVDDRDGALNAVRTLVLDPELRREMGQAAHERCCELFSIEASATAWRSLLATLS